MIYLDFNATTPVAEPVLAAMTPWFSDSFANAASAHLPGRHAAGAVDRARRSVAALLACEPGRLVFTSGATEANNLALKGLLPTSSGTGRLLVSTVEHKSVLEVAASLSKRTTVEMIAVDEHGRVDLNHLERLLASGVTVASVIAANNEVGTLNPIAEIAAMVHCAGGLLHTDATQWAGKLPLDVNAWGVDLLSLSAHKLYGPKGIGALYVRNGVRLEPLLDGGGQERGLRGGTLNVPAIVGFGAACALAASSMATEVPRVRALRDRMLSRLRREIAAVTMNGDLNSGLPNTLNVRFAGAEADAVLAGLPGLAASTGSACTSAVPTPSHVLEAMGHDSVAANQCVRISLGRPTVEADIDEAVRMLAGAVDRVRQLAGGRSTRVGADS